MTPKKISAVSLIIILSLNIVSLGLGLINMITFWVIIIVAFLITRYFF